MQRQFEERRYAEKAHSLLRSEELLRFLFPPRFGEGREGSRKPTLTASELERAIAEIERANQPETNSLNSLIRDWEQSPEWTALGNGTKKTWGSQLERISERWGDRPLTVWGDVRMKAKVVAWRDSRAANPRGADLGVMVLRELLKFGVLRGRVLMNVAEVAEVVGWSPDRVSGISRTYVDQSRVIVAMGERISRGGVNASVNR